MTETDGLRRIPKWGFGMAPLTAKTIARYCNAVRVIEGFIDMKIAPEDVSLESVSEVKGLVNRCIQQDQWDWFTVFAMFGEPDFRDLHRASSALQNLRLALKDADATNINIQREALSNCYFLTHCKNFLGEAPFRNLQPGEGYAYILGTREQSDILKIGMTTRSVSERVKEINSATGLVFPFGARAAFRVRNAREAEKRIFAELNKYRLRVDREFFRINFFKAVSIIKSYLKDEDLLSARTGQIKWFSSDKGYGFIAVEDNEDIFFHVSEVNKVEQDKLAAGVTVQYQIGHRRNGTCARNIKLTE